MTRILDPTLRSPAAEAAVQFAHFAVVGQQDVNVALQPGLTTHHGHKALQRLGGYIADFGFRHPAIFIAGEDELLSPVRPAFVKTENVVRDFL